MGIDTRSLVQGPAGIATYVRNILDRIPWLDPLQGSRPANNLLWNCLRVPIAQAGAGWHLYHAPSYTSPLVNFCPVVLTAPDVSYLARPEYYPYQTDRLRLSYYRACLRRADRIIVTSQYSGSEVERLFPELRDRIRCIYLGVSSFFRPSFPLDGATRQRLGLPDRYILHVGDLHARRNLDLLGRVSQKLDVPLVLVGRILEPGTYPAAAIHLSDLPLETLRMLYCSASVFAYPSLYEGFGLPVLEAMACGVPVVASNRSCLPEICAGAALTVAPREDLFVEAVETALAHPEEWIAKGRERAAWFRWEKTALETMDVYRELL